MAILLVEDDPFKQELIEAILDELAPGTEIILARSVQQAVEQIQADVYELIVLDMALPSHESRAGGAQPISQLSGGIEVLLELGYDERADPVVIFTQYPEIEFDGRLFPIARARQALSGAIKANIRDAIFFKAQSDSWREQFRKAFG